MNPEVTAHVHRPYIKSETNLSVQLDINPGTSDDTAASHLAICIDTSSSMSNEDKLDKAKEALTDWVFALVNETDYLSIVAFDSDPEVVVDHNQWKEVNRDDAERKVNSLSAGGTTDMFGALEKASELLSVPESDGPVAQRILLLSDGKQNSPRKSSEDFERLANQIDGGGTRIRAGGIGSDYNEETIKALGTSARGKWIHVQEPRMIRDFFGTAVEEAQTVIGPDAEVQFDFRPGVEVIKSFRAYPQVQPVNVEWDDNTAIVKLPDLRDRKEQKLAMELHVPSESTNGAVTLADIEVRSRRDTWATTELQVTYTDDNEKLKQVNEDVDLHLRKTNIRSKIGEGDIDAAETILEETKIVHDKSDIGAIEQQVTKVDEQDDIGVRNETTLVESESDGFGE